MTRSFPVGPPPTKDETRNFWGDQAGGGRVPTFGIVGSRDYPNEKAVRGFVRAMAPGTVVVSGGREGEGFRGRGVDVWAADEAERCGLEVVEFLPDKRKHGSPACFHVRNRQIVEKVKEQGGVIYAFSRQPITPGTASTLRYASQLGVPAVVADADGDGPIITRNP